MILLRTGTLHGVGRGDRTSGSVTHRFGRNLVGRRQVLIHERRRDLQRGRYVVKTVMSLVARQQHGGVDLQVQQIRDGVGIFPAIEPV